MTKSLLLGTAIVLAGSLFTGCARNAEPLEPYYNNTNAINSMYSENDVDMSDLDENLSEPEMMIVETNEASKLPRIPFPTAEYRSLRRMGKGTIKGSIYVSDLYNEKVMGASTRLYLNPVTSYSKQWYDESYLGGRKMEKADSRLFNYMKFTTADTEGNFAFYGVPSGSYYLIGTVKCGNACGYESDQNIRIATRVTVQGNQVIKQDLTRNSQ